jgi:hypothetical protein
MHRGLHATRIPRRFSLDIVRGSEKASGKSSFTALSEARMLPRRLLLEHLHE